MAHQLQYNNSGSRYVFSVEFIVVCVVAFISSVSATVYFSELMGFEMGMPGGWKMSMMWMQMPGQTWLLSGLSFLFMWLTMMVAMMMSSAFLMFLKTQRNWLSLCYMASGYFAIWLLAGVGIYILGVVFNNAAMRSANLSRAVPFFSGTSLIILGAFQLTGSKMKHVLRCRSPFGCACSCPQNETSFRLGCKQGMACCACCYPLMIIQVILGMMNLFVMAVITMIITAEKLLPRPEVTARFAGMTSIAVGIIMDLHWAIPNA
jgi:predicted metal-binding membrane protein